MTQENAVYISELAKVIDRREGTIRAWCRTGRLPDHLQPLRRRDGWRYWTPEQVEGVKVWMVEEGIGPGSGLRSFTPTPEQADRMLAQLREPRSKRARKR